MGEDEFSGVGVSIRNEVFRAIFEQSPFSIQILSADGRTLRVNAAWEKLWGLTAEQLQGYNMLEDQQLIAKGVMPFIRRGFAGEAIAVPPVLYDPITTLQGGKRRWVRAFISPLKDATGQIENVILVHEDVTHRLRTGETLHKSKEQLSAVLDALVDSITVQDIDGNIVYSNQAAAQLMGFEKASDLVQASAENRLSRFEVFDEHGAVLPLSSLPGRRVLRGEPENEARLHFRMKATGLDHWAVVRGVPVYDAQGELRFAISIFHDITERKQIEGERQRLLERIESKRAMLEAVLQQLPVGVLIIDVVSGQMTRVNKQFADIWRYPVELLRDDISFQEGKGYHLDGTLLKQDEWPLQRALQFAEQVQHEELQIVRGDHDCGMVQMSAGPVRDTAGNLIAVVETLVDVTERKQVEDQIRFQARLLDTVGQGVIASDIQGHITYWNQASEKLFGWSREDVIGKNVMEIMPTYNSYASSEAIMEQLKQGKRWQGETEVNHREGYSVPILTVVSPVLNDRNQVVGMIGTSTDLTERKKAERGQRLLAEAGAVLSSSLNYTTTLESVARLAVPTLADWCSVDILDENGRLERLAITHQDPQKVAWAYDLYRKYPPDMNAAYGVPQALRTGKSEMLTEITKEFLSDIVQDPELLQIMHELDFHSSIVVPLAARGRILGAITFITAESKRRYDEDDLQLAEELARRSGLAMENARLYQEAEQARKAAEMSNRAKDEFLATLSHELRTPLTAMVGWTDLLRSKMLSPEEEERALNSIARSTRSQTQLIEDLLDVSRIITGKLILTFAPIKLQSVVHSAVDAIRPAANTKQIELHLQLVEHPLCVSGDEPRLQQIVGNLLSNAVKFTPPGGFIHITLREVDGQACLVIRDSGKGISTEFLPYVFERFRQADSSSTRSYGGLGLGLSIVRHLVEGHNGFVSVDSDGEDKGATFTVLLPLLIPEKETPSAKYLPAQNGKAFTSADGDDAPPQRLRGAKVLLVEDEDDARSFVEMVLKRQGATVESVASAVVALRTLQHWKPDLIISDIGMPDIDGYGFLKQVRTLPLEQGGGVPAMALTAFARPEDRERAIVAGFQGFLAKPVEPDEIVTAVSTFLDRGLR